MMYPKELFSIREDSTRINLERYDRERSAWYGAAQTLYPDYFAMPLRKRLALRDSIDSFVAKNGIYD